MRHHEKLGDRISAKKRGRRRKAGGPALPFTMARRYDEIERAKLHYLAHTLSLPISAVVGLIYGRGLERLMIEAANVCKLDALTPAAIEAARVFYRAQVASAAELGVNLLQRDVLDPLFPPEVPKEKSVADWLDYLAPQLPNSAQHWLERYLGRGWLHEQ